MALLRLLFRLQAELGDITFLQVQKLMSDSFKIFIPAYVSCIRCEAEARCVPRARLAKILPSQMVRFIGITRLSNGE